MNLLRKYSEHELLSVPDTRFAFTLIQLQRFLECKTALQPMMRSAKWDAYKQSQYVSIDLGRSYGSRSTVISGYNLPLCNGRQAIPVTFTVRKP